MGDAKSVEENGTAVLKNCSVAPQLLAPELLAPAGNLLCAKAAVENGADAVYFGLQSGFNARARADNVTFEQLPLLMEMLHGRGVKGYTTLNTLAFTDELPRLEKAIRSIASSGVDAILVQDFGVACLAREVCPDLEIHASTQMTLTDAEAIEEARKLGIRRAVLPRELSIKEIQKILRKTDMPLEVFVHGALCVAYSGQCLTSESLGGRSANRGVCAQACRLPYEMKVDGTKRDLGDVRYILSPQDLAAYELIPSLVQMGIASLKIEGRLKTPEYVANIVSHYRNAIDSAIDGNPLLFSEENRTEMELSFSRGFTPGWLEGNDHKRLVPGLSSAKRGVKVGTVLRKVTSGLVVQLDKNVAAGDGIVLEGDRVAGKEFGGRIFEVLKDQRIQKQPCQGNLELRFEHGLINNAERQGCEFFAGQSIFKTDDPKLNKRLRKTFQHEKPVRSVPIDLHCKIHVGEPICIEAKYLGYSTQVISEFKPEVARKHPLNSERLQQQMGRLGGTGISIDRFDADILGSPMVPLSILGSIRKQLIQDISEKLKAKPKRSISSGSVLDQLLKPSTPTSDGELEKGRAVLKVLCRTMDHIKQVLDCGHRKIVADFQDVRQYKQAVELVKSHGGEIELATLRIHKPGEDGLLKVLGKSGADSLLVRNLVAAKFAKQNQIPFTVDFSLNISNPISANWWRQYGASMMTPSFDLNRDQMIELAGSTDPSSLEVVIHQHIPMFHMEHCVFCSVISPGTNKHNCGRPCDDHLVQLVDRVGAEHHLRADIGCRNTLYNAKAQSGAETARKLVELGVKNFRIELLQELRTNEVEKILRLYRRLLDGEIKGKEVWMALNADNRIGVTRGTMEQPRNPLTII